MAVAAMALWIAALAGGLPGGDGYGAAAWHAHEMLYGFAPAALAGFLMTAIPNWTGKMPLSGRPLAALAGLWLAGRLAMLATGLVGVPTAVAIDASFLPILAAVCARELVAGGKWKELRVLAGVVLLALANLGFHAEVLLAGAPGIGVRAGVAAFALLAAIVGGRIIPSFTRNWLAMAGATRLPTPFNRHDGLAIGLGFAGLLPWVAAPEGPVTAAAALAGATAVAWRLARWRGAATWREPLLLVLHVAFGFLALGYVAIAAAALGWLPPPAALHVILVGGIVGLMLAGDARAHRPAARRLALDGGVLPLPLRRRAGPAGRRPRRRAAPAGTGGRPLDRRLPALPRRVRADAPLRPQATHQLIAQSRRDEALSSAALPCPGPALRARGMERFARPTGEADARERVRQRDAVGAPPPRLSYPSDSKTSIVPVRAGGL